MAVKGAGGRQKHRGHACFDMLHKNTSLENGQSQGEVREFGNKN